MTVLQHSKFASLAMHPNSLDAVVNAALRLRQLRERHKRERRKRDAMGRECRERFIGV